MSLSHGKAVPRKRLGHSGSALIEFALVLPLLFLLIINVVNFGGMMHAWITVSQAARNGAQYWMLGSAVYNGLSRPTAAQVSTLVKDGLKGLPNAAGATVSVCINNAGTVTCSLGSATPTTDPEGALFALGSVDVTYTFTPYVSVWNFAGLGIHLTLPATSIHRQCVMRLGGG
jgi:Flp pilus assembly protein TadG